MEMVAAARLRRAEQRIEALRPYADAIRRMTRQAAKAAGAVPRLPILDRAPRTSNTVGLLLVAGDRGLAGAFNSKIVRAGVAAAREHEAEGRSVGRSSPPAGGRRRRSASEASSRRRASPASLTGPPTPTRAGSPNG